MKIGVMRHFKVDYKAEKNMNSNDFKKYVDDYDSASVIQKEVDLGDNKWDKCYCSDLPRAYTTASSIYKGDIETTKLLREVKMSPVMKLNFKIPTSIWSAFSRAAWKLNHKSQLETSLKTAERAKEFLNSIDLDSDENILIVSHGFFLITLISELRKRGFKGDIPKKMENAVLYVLEK